MIERNAYIEVMNHFKGNEFVKILTGVRRSGKSSLLRLFADNLLSDGVKEENLIQINFEQAKYQSITNAEELYSYVKKETGGKNGHFYILIDEIQEVENWAKSVNSMRVDFDCDLYITGSNSHLFAGEHLTYLAGRYVEIKVFPLSYREFLTFRGYKEETAKDHLNEYIKTGSFPAMALTEDANLQHAIISGLFDSVFTRDILLRGKIKDIGTFNKVASFLFENIGSITSANTIVNTLKSSGHKTSSDTVDNYLSLMTSSYLLYQCQRYDLRGKERLKTNGKYYIVDTAIRSGLLGKSGGDLGHVIENLVYIELLRSGHQVFVGKLNNMEIDFVAMKGEKIEYYQVSLSALDENVFEREMKPLKALKDNFPKYLISLDTMNLSSEGIIHKNLVDFLMEG